MSIFKKKKIVKNSEDYNKFLDLCNLLSEFDFDSTIAELCTVERTLKFYEKHSPDWECEMGYYKRCQKTLLTKIGGYDSTRQEMIDLLNRTTEEDCKNFVYPRTSHEIIRTIVKNRKF